MGCLVAVLSEFGALLSVVCGVAARALFRPVAVVGFRLCNDEKYVPGSLPLGIS